MLRGEHRMRFVIRVFADSATSCAHHSPSGRVEPKRGEGCARDLPSLRLDPPGRRVKKSVLPLSSVESPQGTARHHVRSDFRLIVIVSSVDDHGRGVVRVIDLNSNWRDRISMVIADNRSVYVMNPTHMMNMNRPVRAIRSPNVMVMVVTVAMSPSRLG